MAQLRSNDAGDTVSSERHEPPVRRCRPLVFIGVHARSLKIGFGRAPMPLPVALLRSIYRGPAATFGERRAVPYYTGSSLKWSTVNPPNDFPAPPVGSSWLGPAMKSPATTANKDPKKSLRRF